MKKTMIFSNIILLLMLLVVLINFASASTPGNISSCQTLDTAGTYTLNASITDYDSGNCFTITADNVTLDGQGNTIDGDGINSGTEYYGVYASGRRNITIKNLVIKEFGDYNYYNDGVGGGINLTNVNNSFFDNVMQSYGGYGVLSSNSFNNNFSGLNTSYNAFYGFRLSSGSNNTLTNLTASSNEDNGLYFATGASGNTVVNYVFGVNTDSTVYSGSAANTLLFIDLSDVRYYSFTGLNLVVRKTGLGEIRFLSAISVSGSNFSSDIQIGNNFAYVNSSKSGLNKSANITLYGTPGAGKHIPVIKKDGVACGSACYKLTSLRAETVVFNVSGWSNYSIGEGNAGDEFDLSGCTELNISNTNYLLWGNVNDNVGTCFNITADNVTLNGQGYLTDGDNSGTDYGIYAINRNNITIKNINISNFYDGIYFESTFNSVFSHANTSSNTLYGIYLSLSLNISFYNIISDSFHASSDSIINSIIYNNSYGEINFFLNRGNLIGNNFNLNTFNITNNSIKISENNISSLDVNTNLTLRGYPGAAFVRHRILKNGVACSNCYNFTSLEAANVIFNVTGAGNYSIGGLTSITYLSACANLTEENGYYVLTSDLANSTTCFNILANGITLDGNGHSITGTIDLVSFKAGTVSVDSKIGQMHSALRIGNYFYGGSGTQTPNPTQINKINLNNVSDIINYTVSGSLGGMGQMTYVESKNKIYGIDYYTAVWEIDPNNLSYTNVVGQTNTSNQHCAIVDDETDLYVLTHGGGSYVYKYNLTDFSLANYTVLNNGGVHAAVYDNETEFIYATTTGGVVIKINSTDLTYTNVSLGSLTITDDIAIAGDYLYVPSESTSYIFRINKNNISDYTSISLVYAGSYGTFYDGKFVWTTLIDYYLNFLDPLTLKKTSLLLNDILGGNIPNEIVFYNDKVIYAGWGSHIGFNHTYIAEINKTKSSGDKYYGVAAASVSNVFVKNLNFTDFLGYYCNTSENVCNWGGILFENVNSSSIQNILSNLSSHAVFLSNSNFNTISNVSSDNSPYGIKISNSNNNNFTLNLTGNSYQELFLDNLTSNGNCFADSIVNDYRVDNTSRLCFEKLQFGRISLLNVFNALGNDLFGQNGSDIIIGNNSFYFNGSKSALNVSAEITVFSLPTNIARVNIYNGEVQCTDCYSVGSLNTGNLTFNVSRAGNYSVSYTLDTTTPLVTISNPTATTYTSTSIPVSISINEAGSCNFSVNSGITNYSMSANSSNTGFSATYTAVSGSYTLNAYCKDNAGNINNTESVSFSVELPSGGTSSGGGGSGIDDGQTSSYLLKIIVPAPISIFEMADVTVPIQLYNEGQFALKDIKLKTDVTSNGKNTNDIVAVLSESKIDSLAIQEKKDLTLLLQIKSNKDADYVIEIVADVKKPKFEDSARLYISVLKDKNVSETLLFMEQLLMSNPECAELKELTDEAKELYEKGDMVAALEKVGEAIASCKRIISQKYAEESSGDKLLGNIVLGILIAFTIVFVFYFVKLRKIRRVFRGK